VLEPTELVIEPASIALEPGATIRDERLIAVLDAAGVSLVRYATSPGGDRATR
jgi:hypothetical protein